DDDKMAVLDSSFRVRGTAGLRVVDASVFPKIPGTFTAVSTYMIAEKAADVILQQLSHTFGMPSPNETKTINDQSNSNLDINNTTAGRRHMRRDPNGVFNIGRDGVLRSLNADHTVVLDYRRLSPEEIEELIAPADQATKDALVGVDGRDVTDEAQLWAVPIVNTVADESKIYKPAVRADQKTVSAVSSDDTPVEEA
ncbi:hypothetical protein KCU71_g5873, partial [Aureobasidium melanogenum]